MKEIEISFSRFIPTVFSIFVIHMLSAQPREPGSKLEFCSYLFAINMWSM